jgi:hypothetical protein
MAGSINRRVASQVDLGKSETVFRITKQKGWRCDSNDTVCALQMCSPDFGPQGHLPKKKNNKTKRKKKKKK